MEREIVEKVKAQFGRQAERYAESRPHATGTSLDLMVEWATPTPTDRVLDVATGTGFTAFAFAAFARRVVATDLTANMLIQAHRLAGERTLNNLLYSLAEAEALPFRDGVFDVATCRIAPHHFSSVPRFLAEMHRVLRSGGTLILCDSSTPDSPREWKRMTEEAGFHVERMSTDHRSNLSLSNWVRTSGNDPPTVMLLRERYLKASPEVRNAFQIRFEGEEIHFSWMLAILLARRA
ncbi:MAG: methylase [candidate division NC10 bacterium]|nr:methylase [candidate division NC10 bacterium]